MLQIATQKIILLDSDTFLIEKQEITQTTEER
jgi:hypothetical protein